jgi:Uma2 family endonuclease
VTALPDDPPPDEHTVPFDPNHYHTVADFAALPEDNSLRYELQEGVIVVSPRPAYVHQVVSGELYLQVRPQLPRDLAIVQELDVDLQLPTPRVRIPDLIILPKDVARRDGLKRASDILVAIEILSPGSVDLDTKVKPMEYADAGIPHAWLIDPRPPITATVFHLVDGEYQESQRAEHTLTVSAPCELTIDLDALRPD